MKSRTSWKRGHVGSKTRSLGQILEKKSCVLSRGYIFSQILMKLGENVCLDEISDKFENGSFQVKKYVTRSYQKNLCLQPRHCDLNPCSLMLYNTNRKAQVSDPRAIKALLFHFPKMFSTLSETNYINLVMLKLSSTDAFNLDESTLLILGKELIKSLPIYTSFYIKRESRLLKTLLLWEKMSVNDILTAFSPCPCMFFKPL